ncbi:MAG TPA: PQQ-binding-like beta-propeller repeat protein [Gemmataceae bacterium]
MKMKTLLASCVVVAAVSLVAADWTQWQGPDRTNVSQETGLLKKWPAEGPKLLWTFPDAGVGYAGPAIVGDRLYTMGADETKEYVFAIDLKTRKKLWSSEIGPLFVNPWCDGPRGTPTVDGDLVFALGGQGNLICVKADSGEKVWRKQFKQELAGAQMSGWGYTESPLVDGDQVVTTPGGDKGAIAAFNKKSGSLLWRSQAYTDKAAYSSLVLGEVGGIRQYVQRTGDSVAGVAAKDGRLLWRFPHKAPTAAIPTPIVADNYVFSTSGYGAGCVLIQLTPNGQEIKADEVYANKDMTNHHGGVVKVGDYIYGHSDKGGWMCMEFKTGKVLWKETRKLGKGSITCADGHLYCFSENDGTVVLIEASPDGWKESGKFKLPQQTMLSRKRGKIWTHPVVADGRLYLRDQDLIFCYDISGH